ncbi:acyclic terpene utilization AtuA family protein [Pseudooceanicola aestuarii]|uniref:acyclic terpene utilization AtuA family protein n=1 Tax=Pseudooceanicola aestuarii TaxID=2697319 RepID=UPI001EF78827|nr:acyclic terpene utilization AtuA family protein [Pseudooceanicola aestuarii]
MDKTIRIGGASAAWGDTTLGMAQLVEAGGLDYIVGDYLAEVTMAILARMRAKSDDAGFIPDWLTSVRPVLGQIHAAGTRLITNSGGMNPLACRDAFQAMAAEAGLTFRVAVVTGDDLLAQQEEIRASGLPEMFTGASMPEAFRSLNAYLGAGAIARALDEGADVVITGRVVDSAMVLGPLVHEFGWAMDDWDRLAQGSLAGHVIECGAQATGGLITDWEDVQDGWADMGFPIIDCVEDGSFTVGMPAGKGGRITPAAVAEQIVYEIGDPAAYRLPDVTCDFRDVRLEQVGPDRVRVSGARGYAPGRNYKVCGTWHDGFRLISTYMLAGGAAAARGRRMAEALIERTERLMSARGFAPYTETSVEVIGADDSYGPAARRDAAREVIVKIGLRHADARALEVFAHEFVAPGVSTAQGLTGAFGGRPRPAPVLRVHSFLWPKSDTPVHLHQEGGVTAVGIPAPGGGTQLAGPAAPQADPGQPGDPHVPLRAIAVGRSGDKGNDANIGLIARDPALLPRLLGEVTEEAVAQWFAHYLRGDVTRFVMPGFSAVNFLLTRVLGGGGSASLRYDPQAKTYAQVLLDMPVRVPADWLAPAGPLAGVTPLATGGAGRTDG